MRILHCVLDYAPRATGGAEHQARLQADELARRGHAVDVICPRQGREGSGRVGEAMVRRLWRINRRPFRTATTCASLAWFLLRHGRSYDLIHVHLADLRADVAAFVCALIRRPLYVKVAAGGPRGEMGSGSRYSRFVGHYGLRHAACVQAISAEIEGQLGALGISPVRIARIPNGIDTSAFAPAGAAERTALRATLQLQADAPIALYVGRFATAKGLPELLAAWPRITAETRAWLLLVGYVAFEDPYPIPADVPAVLVREWTDNPAGLYRSADAYVLPSHVEGMSNALLEAMACGLASVATTVGAAPEMIEDGRNGFLIEPGDTAALGKRLVEVLSSVQLRARLGAAAAATVGDRYSIGRVVDLIEARYSAIARQRKRAS